MAAKAKFHLDPIWNNGALGFLNTIPQQQEEDDDYDD